MYIGVDVGGSKILVAASADGREILRSRKIDTPAEGAQGMAEVIQVIEQLVEGEPVKAIGVASAGNIDRDRGILLSSGNRPGWHNLKIGELLRNHFNAPASLNNDVEAAVIAESRIGAGQDYPYVLYVTISTGIGAGLAINGELYHGAHNLEAGHMIIDPNGPVCDCGGKGHFEAIASGKAIHQRYGKYGYEITDPKIWDEIAGTMAPGFYNYVRCYSPSVIVVGGGIGAHYPKFHGFLVKHLEKFPLSVPLPPIVQAKYSETAVVYGALIMARRQP